jgi:hypothetical protein
VRVGRRALECQRIYINRRISDSDRPIVCVINSKPPGVPRAEPDRLGAVVAEEHQFRGCCVCEIRQLLVVCRDAERVYHN